MVLPICLRQPARSAAEWSWRCRGPELRGGGGAGGPPALGARCEMIELCCFVLFPLRASVFGRAWVQHRIHTVAYSSLCCRCRGGEEVRRSRPKGPSQRLILWTHTTRKCYCQLVVFHERGNRVHSFSEKRSALLKSAARTPSVPWRAGAPWALRQRRDARQSARGPPQRSPRALSAPLALLSWRACEARLNRRPPASRTSPRRPRRRAQRPSTQRRAAVRGAARVV